MAGKIQVSFDDFKIHVLDAEKYSETQSLQDSSTSFVQKTSEFQSIVTDAVEVLEKQAQAIEKEKLKAIGLRNRVESEPERRKRKQQELHAIINEKRNQLERYRAQLESLNKVEADQKALIDKLANNEA